MDPIGMGFRLVPIAGAQAKAFLARNEIRSLRRLVVREISRSSEITARDRKMLARAIDDLWLDPTFLGGVQALLSGGQSSLVLPEVERRCVEILHLDGVGSDTPQGIAAQVVARVLDANVRRAKRSEREGADVGFRRLELELAAIREALSTRATGADATFEPTPAQPLVRLPLRSEPAAFFGRSDDLTSLLDLLRETPGATPALCALTGLGGLGKTRLAVEAAHAVLEDKLFSVVWWVRAAGVETLLADLEELARMVDPSAALDAREAAKAALRWLRTTKEPWLLVYDDATTSQQVESWLPDGGPGRVIVTSRYREGWRGRGKEKDVGSLTTQAGIDLLANRSGVKDVAGLEDIVTRLAGHPLALTQAGAYLAETGCDTAEYLAELERDVGRTLERPLNTSEYSGSVAAVIRVSRRRAERESQQAGFLLDLYSYVAPDAIPRWLFTGAKDNPVVDLARWREALSALNRFSLVTVENANINVHRLTQDVTRYDHDRARLSTIAIRGLIMALPEGQPEELDAWPEWRHLLPHLVAAGDLAFETSNPEACWSLLISTGRYARAAAHIALALRLFTMANDLLASHPDAHEGRLTTRRHLGVALVEAGNAGQAHNILRECLDQSRMLYPEGDARIVSAMVALATALFATEDIDGALGLEEEALRLVEAVEGALSRDALVIRTNLGASLTEVDRLEDAVRVLEMTVSDSTQVLGERDLVTLQAIDNLAVAIRKQGDYQRADALEEKVLEARRSLLGDEHPDVTRLLRKKWARLRIEERHAEATDLGRRILAAEVRALGEENGRTLVSLVEAADGMVAGGEIGNAAAIADEVEERLRGGGVQEMRNVYDAVVLLARLNFRLGRLPEARRLQLEAIERGQQLFGPEDTRVLDGIGNLARTEFVEGHLDRAQELLEYVVGKLGDEGHEARIKVVESFMLGRVLLQQGRAGEAVDQLSRALGECEKLFGSTHPLRGKVQRLLETARDELRSKQAALDRGEQGS